MDFNPAIMKAVEQSAYRVTVGDVAAQVGLNVEEARRGLLTLAAEVGGHLQVAETGDIAYVFPPNLRSILQQKFWQLRFRQVRDRLWGVIFYLIRISFGLLLILSIVIVFLAILAIVIAIFAASASNQKDDRRGNSLSLPRFDLNPYWLYVFFDPGYGRRRYRHEGYPRQFNQREKPGRSSAAEPQMNFLEAVFSFLFGDEIPNLDLDERRWQAIAATIRNQAGAITAEQITPYLDELDGRAEFSDEDYILPVLVRFNGQPSVSPTGDIVYYFPELQVTAESNRRQAVSAYLKEQPWQFSAASRGQLALVVGLGALNLGLIGLLGALFYEYPEIVAQLGGFVSVVFAAFGVFVTYGVGFFAVPGLRYLWIQRRNAQIEARNSRRQARAERLLEPDETLQAKIRYAKQFAATVVVDEQQLAYTSERSLLEQDIEKSDQIDAEWQRRLEERERDRS